MSTLFTKISAIIFVSAQFLLMSCQDIVVDTQKLTLPQIAPTAGTYTTDVTVTITHEDLLAAIRYTTNNTTPTESSNLYAAPFALDYADTVITAKAFRVGYAASDAITRQYKFSWRTVTDMLNARSFFGIGVISSKIYVYGGTINAPECYDPVTKTWTTFAALSNTRYGGVGAWATTGGKLYAIGGYTNAYVTGVEEWDPLMPASWAAKTALGSGRRDAAGTAYNGSIFVFGGAISGQENGTSTVLAFDPVGNTWATKTATLSSVRIYPTACTVGTKIFIFGGLTTPAYACTNAVDIYDPVNDSRTSGTVMPVSRYCHAAAAYNGKIYVFGGNDGTNYLTRVDIYDPATDTWSRAASDSPVTAWCLSAVTLGDAIYVVGGKNTSNAAIKTVRSYHPLND